MKRFDDLPCSIARTLDVVGEWWTPLILRDVFYGVRRFEDLRDGLGMARNVLTTRLNRLVDEGILERRRYQERPPRFEYRLTDKGRDLFGVLMALMAWGDRWLTPPGEPAPVEMVHRCGEVAHPVVVCDRCGQQLHARDVTPRPRLGQTLPAAR